MSNPIAMMVDVETLSRLPSAYVAQIGYCVANLDTGEIIDTGTIDLAHEGQESRHQEDETIQWWLSQDKAVFQAVFQGENRISKDDAFQFLKGVVEKYGVDSVWAKQASFDFAILSDLWAGKRPWNFRAESEMRVMSRYMDPDGALAKGMEASRARMAHHAGDDAKFQMQVLIPMHQRLKALVNQAPKEAQGERVDIKAAPLAASAPTAATQPGGPLTEAYKMWDHLATIPLKDGRLIERLGGFAAGTHITEVYGWFEYTFPNFCTDEVMSGLRIEFLDIQERTCEKYLQKVMADHSMRERYAQLLERQSGETFDSHIERCVRADIADGEDVALYPDIANQARHEAEMELLELARADARGEALPPANDHLQGQACFSEFEVQAITKSAYFEMICLDEKKRDQYAAHPGRRSDESVFSFIQRRTESYFSSSGDQPLFPQDFKRARRQAIEALTEAANEWAYQRPENQARRESA